MNKGRMVTVAIVAMLAGFVGACGGASGDGKEDAAPRAVLDNSLPPGWNLDTIDGLFTRSEKIALVEVVEEEWRGIYDCCKSDRIEQVIYELRVVTPYHGTTVGETIRMDQFQNTMGVGREVAVGEQYLVFLRESWPNMDELKPADMRAGLYGAWNNQSIYLAKGSEFTPLAGADEDMEVVPRITLADLAALPALRAATG